MDILNKPIKDFTFANVVSFCQEGHREGLQIDYKRDLPSGGLAKFFSAFSNTRGGIIIIGVEEDRTTGIPTAWDGIDNNAQSIERVHQWASNVEPIPSYEVHATDEQGGKIFILIRIFEGDRTPYYVQNDPRIYIRTGNITPSVDLASPEAVELLIGKREKAELARRLYIQMSDNVYRAGLKRAERERLKKIAIEKENYNKEKKKLEADIRGFDGKPYKSRYYSKILGSDASIFTIVAQPFYPNKPIATPAEIKDKTMEIRDGDRTFQIHFPSLNTEPMPDGVMCFEWGEDDGTIRSEQLYSTGLVRFSFDVLNTDAEGYNKTIYLVHLASFLFAVLKATGNFYSMFGYQGGIKGFLSLDNVEGVKLDDTIGRSLFPRDDIEGLLPSYRLDFDIDTSLLNDNKAFQDYFVKMVQDIYWMFGYAGLREETIKTYLTANRWWVE